MNKQVNKEEIKFQKLSENNKRQFLEFLLKNNIEFKENKENYVAKITTQHSIPLQLKKVSPYRKVSKTPKTDRKLKNTTPILTTPLKQSNKVKLTQSHHPLKVYPNLKIQAPAQPKSTSLRKDLTLQHRGQHLPNRTRQSSYTPPPSKSIRIQAPKKQTKPLRQSISLKYSQLFRYDFTPYRPIRWPNALLQKTLQDIYDDIFIVSTHFLQQKSFKALSQQRFSQLIQLHFEKKSKAKKQVISTINNLLYTLECQLQRQHESQQSSSDFNIFLKTFQDFLLRENDSQDLVFYLFMKSILKKSLAKDSFRVCSLVGLSLSPREMNRFIKTLVGRDSPELVQEYKSLVQTPEMEAYHLLHVLLRDFKRKRQMQPRLKDQDNKCVFAQINCFRDNNTYHRDREDREDMGDREDRRDRRDREDRRDRIDSRRQELTFGDDNTQREQFWDNEIYKQVNSEVFQMIQMKLQKKVKDLFRIVYSQSDQKTMLGQQQVSRKALCLVKALFQMNKVKWFKQLHIDNPNEEDIFFVQKLQMRLLQIKKNPNTKDIVQFCKIILTTDRLLHQLQQSF